MDLSQRILTHAHAAFMKYGVRSITMDEVARDLGISKKTIYQYYENKAALVYAVAQGYFQSEEKIASEISAAARDAIDEIVRVARWSFQTFRSMSPNLVMEIRKYYPRSWEAFDCFRSGFIHNKVRENLQRGIQEGLYRAELNVEIVAQVRVNQIEFSLKPEAFPPDRFDPVEVQHQLFELYLLGIMTPRGLALYRHYAQEDIDPSLPARTA